MVTSFHLPLAFTSAQRRNRVFLLAVLWIAGLLSGAFAAINGGDVFLLWMRAADFGRVSIVSLTVSLFLPFLLSALAVLISQPWLIFPICFLKAFSFSFCAGGTLIVFSSAGWLVCALLLFSGWCLLPALFWFWLRRLNGSARSLLPDALVCAALCFLIGSIDRCMVSPFLAMLIEI